MGLRAGVGAVAFGQWAVREDRVRASSATPGGALSRSEKRALAQNYTPDGPRGATRGFVGAEGNPLNGAAAESGLRSRDRGGGSRR